MNLEFYSYLSNSCSHLSHTQGSQDTALQSQSQRPDGQRRRLRLSRERVERKGESRLG